MIKKMSLLVFLLMTTKVIAIETLDYNVIEKDNKIEVRQYSKYIAATVSFDNKEEFDKLAFRTLANYIFGENISMTTPVLIDSEEIGMTAPVLTENTKTSWSMSFTMPKRYTLDTLPTPTNKKVKIVEVPEKMLATIRFSGSRSEDKIKKQELKLRSWLEMNGYSSSDQASFAGYNPPWTLPMFRRNEVLIELN